MKRFQELGSMREKERMRWQWWQAQAGGEVGDEEGAEAGSEAGEEEEAGGMVAGEGGEDGRMGVGGCGRMGEEGVLGEEVLGGGGRGEGVVDRADGLVAGGALPEPG